MRWTFGWLLVTALAACSSDVPWLEPDASATDAGVLDAGRLDASQPDSGEPDDASLPAPDAGIEPDAGGEQDAGGFDAGTEADAGTGSDAGQTPDAGTGFAEDPIVFVHGYTDSARRFDTMLARFRAAGYPDSHLAAIDFSDSYGSNLVAAQELADFVDDVLAATGASKVDLVTHSMGGVAGRLFVRRHGGDLRVRDFATLAGSHHGAYMWWPQGDGGYEMATTYACEGEARNDVQFILNGCLTADGRTVDRDETPAGVEDGGGIAWLGLYSDSDEVLSPTHTACLNQAFKGDCSDPVNERRAGLYHMDFLSDQAVFDRVKQHLQARGP